MKRLCVLLVCLLLLCGCSGNSALDRGMVLRSNLLAGDGCKFDAVLTADYGTELYTFALACQSDSSGNLTFCVTAPESIEGITGSICTEGGKLTFDEHALGFALLADGQITPISAPWLFLKALRSGYMKACEENEDGLHLIINDSYAQDAIQVDVFTDKDDLPKRAELLWQGRRIMTLAISNYSVL